MLDLIRKLRARWEWRTVEVHRSWCFYRYENSLEGEEQKFFCVLKERGNGQRKVEIFRDRRAEWPTAAPLLVAVKAWKLGGSLPSRTRFAPPEPKPKRRVGLVECPRGKGATDA
jgi:hypothetical protein